MNAKEQIEYDAVHLAARAIELLTSSKQIVKDNVSSYTTYATGLIRSETTEINVTPTVSVTISIREYIK